MRRRGFVTTRLVAAAIGGIVLLCLAVSDLIFALKPSVDLYDMDPNDVKAGMHVEMNIYDAMDYYTYETETTTKFGIKVSEKEDTGRTYLIPVARYDKLGNWIGEYYFSVEVRPKNYALYDRMVEETWDRWYQGSEYTASSAVATINGKVKKLSSEKKGFLDDYFADETIAQYVANGDFYPENVIYYEVQPVNSSGIIIEFIAGLILLLIGGGGFLIYFIQNAKNKKATPAFGGAYGDGSGMYGAPAGSYQTPNDPYQTPNDPYQTQNSSYQASYNTNGALNTSNYSYESMDSGANSNTSAYEPDQTIYIGGVPYSRVQLMSVNEMILQGRTEDAKRALMELSHMDEFEADQVIFNWNGYFK